MIKQYQTVKNIFTKTNRMANDFNMTSEQALSQPGSQGSFPNPPTATPTPGTGGYLDLLDGILRRREEFFSEIFESQNLRARLRAFVLTIVCLSFVYGATMGASSFTIGFQRGLEQMLSSGVKVPALYLLTVLISFPALFIILVLMGSKLSFTQSLSLIILALTLNSILLAAFAPIVLFFIITDSSYEFVKLLHVAVMAFSGCWAMGALWHGLREMCEKSNLYPKRAVRILQIWVLMFGFVGTQMAWSLRPFVGSADKPFQIFRGEQEGNFYKAVLHGVVRVVRNATD